MLHILHVPLSRSAAQEPEKPAPPGYSHLNGRLLANDLGNVSKGSSVADYAGGTTYFFSADRAGARSTDPEFSREATDVVGLYLNPPQNALVLCGDGKTMHSGFGASARLDPLSKR